MARSPSMTHIIPQTQRRMHVRILWCNGASEARTHISRFWDELKPTETFMVEDANTIVCSVGISYVIFPTWFDLYTMAARVEYLNIGFLRL